MKQKVCEADITRGIRQYLTMRHIWHFKHWGGPMGAVGIADILGIYRGRFLAIEIKRPGGRGPSPSQQGFLDNVKAAGGIGFCAYSVDDVIAMLDEIDSRLDD